ASVGTITPAGTDTVSGAASLLLVSQWQCAQLLCDGASRWLLLNKGAPTYGRDPFAVAGSAYTLTGTPDGKLFMAFGDGVLQPTSNYSVSGSTVTFGAGIVAAGGWANVEFIYSE